MADQALIQAAVNASVAAAIQAMMTNPAANPQFLYLVQDRVDAAAAANLNQANVQGQAGQAGAQAGAGQGVMPPVVPFLVNPTLAGDTSWDFATGTGVKIYLAAVQPMMPLWRSGRRTG